MSRELTKEECLQLNIETYNKAIELQWKTDKREKNLSGNLLDCKYCGRKYTICCICDEAEERWNNIMSEIETVRERKIKEMEQIKRNKRYLGDGVYAENDGCDIILTTSDGLETTNEIYLEYEVLQALKMYIKNFEKQED